MLKSEDFKQSIKAVDALGATPAVLVKVMDLAKDPTTDLESMCALLRNDGPLAADIIRISNSPYYSPATVHGNLNAAINYVGMREVIRVVNLSLAQQLFARDLVSYGIPAVDYWSESIAAALLMEALAGQSGLNQDDAYTIGILHAIGRLLINRVIQEKRFTIYWDGQEPIQNWERSAVGFDYAEAGALLLEHWRFPKMACNTIHWQLSPIKASEHVSMLGLLQFSLRVLALTGFNFENQSWIPPEDDPFLQAAGLTPKILTRLVSVCEDEFKSVRQTLILK